MNLTTKINLRKKYKIIKQQLLTKSNTNSYHSGLLTNLYTILNKHITTQYQQIPQYLTIGSYINKPITQIIPPISFSLKLINKQILIKYAYPYFDNKSKNMIFYQYCLEDQYQIGSYGVKIKYINNQNKNINVDISNKLDFVLVPLVAFNQDKQRIGEGGGYYDQFIKNVRQKQNKQSMRVNKNIKNAIFIGIGLEKLKIQENNLNIFHENDQKLDYLITEKTIYI